MSDYKPNEIEAIYEGRILRIMSECQNLLTLAQQCREQGNNYHAWECIFHHMNDLNEYARKLGWQASWLKNAVDKYGQEPEEENLDPRLNCGDG